MAALTEETEKALEWAREYFPEIAAAVEKARRSRSPYRGLLEEGLRQAHRRGFRLWVIDGEGTPEMKGWTVAVVADDQPPVPGLPSVRERDYVGYLKDPAALWRRVSRAFLEAKSLDYGNEWRQCAGSSPKTT